jgi:hypothetical protein
MSSRDIVPEFELSEPRVLEVLLDHQSEPYLAVMYISKMKRLRTHKV